MLSCIVATVRKTLRDHLSFREAMFCRGCIVELQSFIFPRLVEVDRCRLGQGKQGTIITFAVSNGPHETGCSPISERVKVSGVLCFQLVSLKLELRQANDLIVLSRNLS